MEIVINGKKIDFEIEREKTVGEILGSIESECEKAGMTVTGLKYDGAEIDAESLDGFFAKSPDSVGTVELTAITGEEILRIMRDLGGRLTGCIPRLQEIPLALQTGKDRSVMETINGCSSDLHSLYQLLPLLPLTGLDSKGPDIDGIPLVDYPAELSPILRDLLDALEKKDTILVGDLSEYELAPRIERLGSALATV